LGLALDEPNGDYQTFNSNEIEILVHPDLAQQLTQFGGVEIDYVDDGPHRRGFTVATKRKQTGTDCSGCSPEGCGGGS
jgi:hypothetical protein